MATPMRGAAMLFLLVLFLTENIVRGFVKLPIPASSSQRNKYSSPESIFTFAVLRSAHLTAVSGDGVEASSNLTGERQGKGAAPPNPFEEKGDNASGSCAAAPKAPLVDSTLLRFISTQKMDIVLSPPEPSSIDEEREGLSGDSGDVQGRSSDDFSSRSKGDPYDERTPNVEKALGGDAGGSNRGINNMGGSNGDSAYLGQYNAHRIAQQLISIGAEEEASFEAGRIVQRHALARTMRRRIRKFLRERDLVWAEGPSPAQSSPYVLGIDVGVNSTSNRTGVTGVDAVIEVLTDSGLTGKDIAAIFTHTPSVATMMARRGEKVEDCGSNPSVNVKRSLLESSASGESATERSGVASSRGETLEETLNRAFVRLLSNKLKLRRYDARKVLRTCPGLLTKRGSISAEQVVTLMSSLGVSLSSLTREKTSLPNLLSRSPAAIFRLVAFLSSESVRMPTKRIGPFMRRSECAALLDAVAPIVTQRSGLPWNNAQTAANDVSFMEDFWGGQKEARRKQIDETYRNMTSTAKTLRRELGVFDVATMLSAKPTVLLLDVPSQILPVVEYLQEIGVLEEDIPRILQSYPILLDEDMSKMRGVVSFLQSLDVPGESLGNIFRAFPSLLTLDVEKNMIPVVTFLRDIGVVNVGRFITRLPPVLGYSVEEELVPKWKYLSQVCQFDYFEVVRFPAYFSYPLERVIKTRYEYLRDVKRVPISLISVDDVVRYGDVDFATVVAGDKDSGEKFLKYASLRKQRRSSGGKRTRPKVDPPSVESTEAKLQIKNHNR